MKRYCMVNVVNQEFLEEYKEAHLNPWRELLESIRNAGTREELIYIYKNLAIIFIECEDIGQYMEKFANSKVGDKWMKKMACLLSENDFADETGKTKKVTGGLEKIFDLNQQLDGKLDQY